MKKLFGETKISYKFLIVFAIIIGILVGGLNRIPFLTNTSFQDIAVYLEMWIILAIFIIVNCKEAKEAVIKCFLFFLISQPIIYLTEIIIDVLVNGKVFTDLFILYFRNYYLHGWLIWTILTIPGSFIAYQVKKGNILSSLILSVACTFLSFTGSSGLLNTILYNFPYHLLNSLICLFMAYYLIFVILKGKKERIISLVLTTTALVLGIVYTLVVAKNPTVVSDIVSLNNSNIITDAYVSDESIANVEVVEEDNYVYIQQGTKIGKTTLTIVDNENNKYYYDIKINHKKYYLEELGMENKVKYTNIKYRENKTDYACITFYPDGDYSMYDCDSEPTEYFFDSESECTYKYIGNKLEFDCEYTIYDHKNNYIEIIEWTDKIFKFNIEGKVKTFYAVEKIDEDIDEEIIEE